MRDRKKKISVLALASWMIKPIYLTSPSSNDSGSLFESSSIFSNDLSSANEKEKNMNCK